MSLLRLGLTLARRRIALTVIAALSVLVPALGAAIAVTADIAVYPSPEQRVSDRFGEDGQYVVVPGAAGGAAAERAGRDREIAAIAAPASWSPALTAFEVPIRGENGITTAINVGERDWAQQFPGLIRLDRGRLPTDVGEAVLTPAAAAALDVAVGDRVTLGSTALAVVGIGVVPLAAGQATAALVAPRSLDAVDLDVVRMEWVSNAVLTAHQLALLSERGYHVSSRPDVGRESSSLLGREPVLFIGFAVVGMFAMAVSARYLTGRSRRGTSAVLHHLGAGRGTVTLARAVEAAVGALAGAALALLLALWVCPGIASRVARQRNMLPPPIGDQLIRLVVFIGVLVLLAMLAAMAETLGEVATRTVRTSADRRSAAGRSATGRSTAGRSVAGSTPALSRWTSGRLGVRFARADRSRSRWIFLATMILSTAATAVFVVVSSVNAQALSQSRLRDQWRAEDVVLYLQGRSPSAALRSALADLVDGPALVVDMATTADVTVQVGVLNPNDFRGFCNLAVVDEGPSPELWRVITGGEFTPAIADALNAGHAIVFEPQCAAAAAVLGPPPDQAQSAVRSSGQIAATFVRPPDPNATHIASGVVSSATLNSRGYRRTPTLLIAHADHPLDAVERQRSAAIVEQAGYPATDLRVAETPYFGVPAPIAVLVAGLVAAMAMIAFGAPASAAVDRRRTLKTLTSIGVGRWGSWLVVWRTSAVATLAGAMTGLCVGIAAAVWWTLRENIPVAFGVTPIAGVLLAVVLLGAVGAALRLPER